MAVTKARVASELLKPKATSVRDPTADAAVTALLDHLAEELAQEYVRLREKAARDERIDDEASR